MFFILAFASNMNKLMDESGFKVVGILGRLEIP
jgi:hypothetical protein